MTGIPAVRDHLALALDVGDPTGALELARRHSATFGVAKVGLELWAAGGPAVVEEVATTGMDVFLDLKLHDIPTTVGRAVTALGRLPIRYLTVHASGGPAMCSAAVEGLAASREGGSRVTVLGVTVLTSDADTGAFDDRLRVASQTCGGVVCSVHEASRVRAAAPDLTIVTPGIRLAGTASHDQARVADPRAALEAGSDLLVVGRTVTAATDPDAAAAAVARQVADVLGVS